MANKKEMATPNVSVSADTEQPIQKCTDHSICVGFKLADELASRVGIHTDSDYRIRSGIFYSLLQAVGEGHCYLPMEELL